MMKSIGFMMFRKSKKGKITVFITQRHEIHSMAQAILRDNRISFVLREEMPSPEDPDTGGNYAIGVDAADFTQARKLLRSLVEFDATLCGR